MRSTATFDPDVSQRLEKRVKATGKTRKAVLNEALRVGLNALESTAESPKPFVLRTFKGTLLYPDRLPSHVLADIEAEDFMEKHREILAQQKSR